MHFPWSHCSVLTSLHGKNHLFLPVTGKERLWYGLGRIAQRCGSIMMVVSTYIFVRQMPFMNFVFTDYRLTFDFLPVLPLFSLNVKNHTFPLSFFALFFLLFVSLFASFLFLPLCFRSIALLNMGPCLFVFVILVIVEGYQAKLTNVTLDDNDPSFTYFGTWGISEGQSDMNYGGSHHFADYEAKSSAVVEFTGVPSISLARK